MTLNPGLYVHIPFCEKKCHYCDFAVTVDRSALTRRRFFKALHFEAAAAHARYGRLKFDTLYFGGGTPSVLSVEEMSGIAAMLRDFFDFTPGCEITCEMNPGDASAEKLRGYRALGVNRASLGAQAFQEDLLKAMGRSHGTAEIFKTVRFLRDAGFENISFDLMFRLPGQTPAHFEESLRQALALGPAQITAYDLEVVEATAYGALQRRGALDLPDEDSQFKMLALAENHLKAAGYRQYEIASFARPGFECRHNLIYWKGGDYLGLGPGAVSFMNGVRYQYASGVSGYLHRCERREVLPETEDRLSPGKRELEKMITGLRLEEGICLADFPAAGPVVEGLLDFWAGHGLVEKDAGRARLARKGRFLAEGILAEIVRHASHGEIPVPGDR